MNQRNRKILLMLALLLLFFSSQVLTVNAQTNAEKIVPGKYSPVGLFLDVVGSFISGIAGGVIGWVAFVIIYIMSLIAGALFSFGGFLIEWLLGLNMKVLGLPTIKLGWEIMLNIANLGFVLAIIIIAFATIFRRETYAMKQTLWKLVVAALLVNFSLVIAGGFIEFSHVFANFFINEATPTVGSQQNGITNFANNLTASIEPQKLLVAKKEWDIDEFKGSFGTTGITPAAANLIISIFFVTVFVFIGALTFLAIAVMLLIRFVVLGILLILAPIVWLFWIFPATKHLWNQWWEKFLRWVFFAPAMLFFLYLVVKTNELKGAYFTSAIEKAKIAEGQAGVINAMEKDLLLNDPMLVLGQMVIMIGLMVGGLIVANKMGIHFSSTALGAAKGGGKAFGAWAGRKGVRSAGWFARPSDRMAEWATDPKSGKIKQFIGSKLYGVEDKINKVKGGISKIPGAKKLAGMYGKPKEPWKINKGVVASVWGGVKSGSGLFKKKEAGQWECQSCNYITTATKKPGAICKNCGNPANWIKL